MKVRSLPGVLLDNPSSNWYNTPMSEKISIVRRLRLEANALGEFQAYASRDYRRMLLDAANEIEQLRKERDEARKKYCMAQSHVDEEYGKTTLPEEIAEERGWDCFNKNPTGNA